MLTQERLKELLSYDPETGLLTWKSYRKGRRSRVGTLGNGYIHVMIDGKLYRAHRLIWLWVYGRWPTHQIDHIDMNRSNNRIDNLREATNLENHRNVVARRDSKTGIRGVVLNNSGSYTVYACIKGRSINCGSFHTIEEATQARLAFVATHYGEFARE